MFDEYFQLSPSVVSRVLPTVALIPANTTGVEEQLQGTDTSQFDNDLFHSIFTPEPSSEESSSRDIIQSNVYPSNPPFEHLIKWIKNHQTDNVIGNPSRPVSTRR
ncbi:hypothetical protein Tco_1000632 [Tanacetum coccineum]